MSVVRKARPARRTGIGPSGRRGTALVEFALILPLLIIMFLVIVDFGRLIQARVIISNVSREGGTIAARQTAIDSSLTTVLKESGLPLNLIGADGRIVISRVSAGLTAGAPNPTITAQISRGTLTRPSSIAAGNSNLGLPASVYGHLQFRTANSTADISEVTVVEVFYRYRPITPFPRGFGGGMLIPDSGGMIVWSRAIF